MDMSWLAAEAQTLHQVFQNLFFVLMTTFLLIGIIMEYFKLPLGGTPQFTQLIGRVFIATILLVAVPEVMNALAAFTDAVVKELGGFNDFGHVLDRLGEKLKSLTISWVSFKDMVLVLISFVSFFALYVTVYLADAFFVFSWMLLYIMSPILVAMYVLPVTASATTALFRSLMQVCVWKITWCVLACLLWSFALSDINKADKNVDFLTTILVNLMLLFSVLVTPKITAAFLGGGISGVAEGFGNTMMQAAAMTPAGMAAKAAAPYIATKAFAKRQLWTKPKAKAVNFAKKKLSRNKKQEPSSK